MPRPPKPLDPGDGPLAVFAIELRALRDEMGPTAPTPESIAKAQGLPRSTVYAALGGDRVPSRDVLAAIVRSWGGDATAWMKKRSLVEAQMTKLRQLARGRTAEHMQQVAIEARSKKAAHDRRMQARASFAQALRDLMTQHRLTAGQVAMRGRMSRSQAYLMTSPDNPGMPKWETVEAFLRGVVGNDEGVIRQWRTRWSMAMDAELGIA